MASRGVAFHRSPFSVELACDARLGYSVSAHGHDPVITISPVAFLKLAAHVTSGERSLGSIFQTLSMAVAGLILGWIGAVEAVFKPGAAERCL